MAGVKTLADGKTKLAILTTAPADPSAPTATELNGGIDGSCIVAKNGTRISATASDAVSDPALCASTNSTVFGASNFEGTVAPFLYLDESTGAYSAGDNAAVEALTPKGSEVWLYMRTGPDYSQSWASGDLITVGVHAITDNAQEPTETGVYVKWNIPLGVQNGWQKITVGAPTVPTIDTALPSGETVGDLIILTGSGFTGTTGITMDSETATDFEVISDTKIAMVIPASVTGAAAIVVTNTTGASDPYAYTAKTV